MFIHWQFRSSILYLNYLFITYFDFVFFFAQCHNISVLRWYCKSDYGTYDTVLAVTFRIYRNCEFLFVTTSNTQAYYLRAVVFEMFLSYAVDTQRYVELWQSTMGIESLHKSIVISAWTLLLNTNLLRLLVISFRIRFNKKSPVNIIFLSPLIPRSWHFKWWNLCSTNPTICCRWSNFEHRIYGHFWNWKPWHFATSCPSSRWRFCWGTLPDPQRGRVTHFTKRTLLYCSSNPQNHLVVIL